MFFLQNMVIEIRSIGFRKCDTSRLSSLSCIKCDKVLFVLLLTVIWFINTSNSLEQYELHGKQQQQQQKLSYGGQFVGEEEAEAIAVEANITLAKIPCNFTTKTNCIYAERKKLSLLAVKDLIQRSQQTANEIVVSWVPLAGVVNATEKSLSANNSNNNSSKNTNNNVREKSQNDFYNFNWIFELLACMMLASAFEICLLVLRNLRNISLAFFGFWSALNASLQNFCFTSNTATTFHKIDPQRKRNAAIGEKRTLSYIFAILTWRASQTAKSAATTPEEHLRDETNENAISYGHVTTMGDLLLLILFTHVYYQRQKVHQTVENNVNGDPEHLLKTNNSKEKDHSSAAYQKLYDKQNNNDNNNAFSEQNAHRRGSTKRCSHFCGNMYQQISSSLQTRKPTPTKLTTLSSCASKIPYLSYCSCFLWYTCCFCQYSCRACCYCCTYCRRWNQRCYIYIPLCSTIYCCCFYKSLKSFHDVNCQYCCYLCCCQDACHISELGSHATYHCCHCHFYCCFCNTTSNKTPVRAINLFLFNKIKNPSLNIYTPSNSGCCTWKLIWNNQNYSILCQLDGQSYSLLHMTDAESMFLYKRNYYQFAVDVFSCLLPQYLLTIKNCPALLKWKRLHVTVLVMSLIVICASSGGATYNHHHYYSSLLSRCNKHFSKCRQNKRRRRRRRQRHQHFKAYRPQHYFYTTLIQCVKRQKTKKLPKNFINKLQEKSIKLLIPNTTNYEQSLAATATSPKTPMVRAVKRVRGSKPNIVWLLIGLIWFEGPKIVNCNVIINYQNQQQQHEQQQQHQQQAGGNTHKETTTNSVNSNFEYKIENFNQMKTKNNNSNSNNNNNNNNNSNNNSNKTKNKNNSNNSTNNSNRSSTTSSSSGDSNNLHLSVNVIPIINAIHLKHYCNSNYHQKLIRSSQRVQRALKTNPNLDSSITSSASLNYNNVNDDLDSEQMPSTSFQTLNEESHAQSDLMRLESIKHQILFKLGLTRKPNVSHPLPKQFIWDTIYRADGIKSFHEFSNTNNFQDPQHFTPQQSYSYWSGAASKGSTAGPAHAYQQRKHQREDRSRDSKDTEDTADSIKRSLENINVGRKKYGKNREQLQQLHQQTHSKHYNNNDITYRKGETATTTSTKNLNQLLYTTTNRNKLINHTNKTVNSFSILKQSKHQQFYKNSPHSTTTTTITSAKKPTIHQQQISQHTNNKNIKNNNNNNNNVNNSNNNKNNNDNSNNINNIIMVQKHLRNNKYIEEAKKFTYLTDINSSDDSLNIMEEYKNRDSDDNNSKLRKKSHHHDHARAHVQPLQLQQRHDDKLNEKTNENYHRLNIDDIVDVGGDIAVNRNVNVEPEPIHDDEGESDNNDDDEGDDYYRHNQHQHRHDNYFSKSDAFDDNEDIFGSTQEIITFAEKGKMYKNHRLVEFSHQNSEKPKQKLHVRYAEIHIRIDKISLKNKSRAGSGIKRKRLKIWIFQLIENNYTYKGFDHVAQFCASFEVDTSRLGWKKFDITTTVKEWYARREGEKLRLLIDCTGCGKMYSVHLFNGNNAKKDVSSRERRIDDERRNANMHDINSKHFYNVTPNNDDFSNLQYNQTSMNADNRDDEDVLNSSRPFLVLHTEASRQRRVRRRAINCNGALHGQCCKESFYVSFKALGWDDWIIAPRGYFANYCRGDCTGPYRTPDTFQTFHAHFIEEYRKMGLLNGMQPCCAPIKFSSMSLIYYGDEGIIKRDLPKMVVDECGCP